LYVFGRKSSEAAKEDFSLIIFSYSSLSSSVRVECHLEEEGAGVISVVDDKYLSLESGCWLSISK
jgi:hypothetical protein